jgi:hypothetical protein
MLCTRAQHLNGTPSTAPHTRLPTWPKRAHAPITHVLIPSDALLPPLLPPPLRPGAAAAIVAAAAASGARHVACIIFCVSFLLLVILVLRAVHGHAIAAEVGHLWLVAGGAMTCGMV